MRPVAVTSASAAQNGQRRGCQSVMTQVLLSLSQELHLRELLFCRLLLALK